MTALTYNAVFAVRRFDIIMMNIFFTAGSPLSDFYRSWYLQKILCFLCIQIGYLSYIHSVKPHSESLFNTLEFVNEYALMALAYLLINFTTIVAHRDPITHEIVPKSESFNSKVEYGAIGIVAFIVGVNFGIMIRITAVKMMLACKKKKALKHWLLTQKTQSIEQVSDSLVEKSE